MLANIIIGLIFVSIVIFAFKKVYNDMKNKKCSCGSSCSDKSKCNKR
jgi:hypothetical protein